MSIFLHLLFLTYILNFILIRKINSTDNSTVSQGDVELSVIVLLLSPATIFFTMGYTIKDMKLSKTITAILASIFNVKVE